MCECHVSVGHWDMPTIWNVSAAYDGSWCLMCFVWLDILGGSTRSGESKKWEIN
jgi:hypothetical protein